MFFLNQIPSLLEIQFMGGKLEKIKAVMVQNHEM